MKVIIIGAGHAGVQAASSLREQGFEGEIQLISNEVELPYQKPPLSKTYLKGEEDERALLLKPESFYASNSINLKLGTKVLSIDHNAKQVALDTGEFLSYDKLIIATGAQNRKLSIPGHDGFGVFYIRTLQDTKSLLEHAPTAKHIIVIGGGFIGLEVAASLAERGGNISVVETENRLMSRVVPPIISEVFEKTHRENGVQLFFREQVKEIVRNGEKVAGVLLANGKMIVADTVIVGIGVVPVVDFSESAGVELNNGIVVNSYMQTSDPDIYAIGDCANHFNRFSGKNIRLESIQNAVDQAKIAATSIIGTKRIAYDSVPWFWTFQYRLKLQMVGFSYAADTSIIRGSVDDRAFSVFHYKNDKLVGVDSVNAVKDHLVARKLIQAGINPTHDQAADIEFNLKSLVR